MNCHPPDREQQLLAEIERLKEQVRTLESELASTQAPSREQMQKELRESESLFRDVLNALPVGVFILDQEGRIVQANPAVAEIWGEAKHVGREKGWWADSGERIAAEEWATARALTKGQTSLNEVITLEAPDGKIRTILNSALPVHDATGRRKGAIAVIQDITERKQAEDELRQTLALLEGIATGTEDLIAAVDSDFRYIYFNEITACKFKEDWGRDLELGMNMVEALAPWPQAQQHAKELWSRALAGETLRTTVVSGACVEKRQIYDILVHPIYDKQGDQVGAAHIMRNITEQFRMQEHLRLAEERYRLINQATNDMIWDWDLINDQVTWNQAVEAGCGQSREEMLSLEKWYELIHPEDRDRVVASLGHALQSGESDWQNEYRFGPPEGPYRTYLDRGLVARDAEGQAYRMIGAMLDLTERKQAEEVLRQTAQLNAFRVDLNDTLQGLDDPFAVQSAASKFLGSDLNADRVLYAEVTEDGEYGLTLAAPHHRVPGLVEQHRLKDFGSHLNDELWNGRTLVVGDVTADERLNTAERAYTAALGIGAYVVVPLIRRDRLVALLAVHQHESRAWLEADIVRIEETARRTWAAVEQARIERDLKEARRAAEDASRAKSEFLAIVSHEIRTPMTVFMAAVEHLLYLDHNPERRDLLELADQSAKRLLTLIDDILDFSRIEACKIELEEAPIDLRECLHKVANMFVMAADQKNVRLETVIAPEVPRRILGDCTRLEQVLINLLGNAVKFTHAGEIRVLVRPQGDRLEFSVADTGIGIPADKRDLVFESFSQADASLTRKYGGTGLGLAICKGLVELMGGEISAQGRPGGGSVFVFTVPLRTGAEKGPTKQEEPANEPGPGMATSRILLVEDDPMIRKMLTMLLSQRGYQVTSAECGRTAMERWTQEKYDIILMDLQMPEINGLEATRMIREREMARGQRTTIIGLTANTRREIKDECLDAEMDHLLYKPVKVQDLYSVIDSFQKPAQTTAENLLPCSAPLI